MYVWSIPSKFYFRCFSYAFLLELQAGGFLVSSKSHVVSEEIELDDHVYSNEDYADTTSLLEKVIVCLLIYHLAW